MKLLYDWIALCFWVPAIEADEMTKRTLFPRKTSLPFIFQSCKKKFQHHIPSQSFSQTGGQLSPVINDIWVSDKNIANMHVCVGLFCFK